MNVDTSKQTSQVEIWTFELRISSIEAPNSHITN